MVRQHPLVLLTILREREFSYFLSTRFLVIFSLYMQTTVLSYLLYKLTKDPLSLGLLGLAEVIPAFSVALFAGYFVDKNEKRTLYLRCILFYILNAIFFIVITSQFFLQHYTVATISTFIYIGMFMSGCIRSFLAPSSFSLIPLLIKKTDMPNAITWSSTTWMLGSILGPLTAGFLMTFMSVTSILVITGIGLSLSSFFIFRIKPKEISLQQDLGIIKSLKEGFRFVFKHQIILAVLSLDLFAVLFGGAEALLPVFSADILKVGEVGFGWLRSAHGIGSLLLFFILSYVPLKTQAGNKMMFSIIGFGLCIILFGISKNFYLSFVCLLVAGMFDGISVVTRHSVLQLETPSEMKGRVSSINMMFISSSNELGAFESGMAARLFGTVPSVVFGGIMTIIVVIITFFAAPKLRALNKLT